MSKDPKGIVKEIIKLMGEPEAERLLIEAGLSPSLAAKLKRGKYKSEVGRLAADAIARAKAKAVRLKDVG
jgi:hypothetical protein